VRWTERRNMEEYLRLIHNGNVKVAQLISNTFPIEKVKEAYNSLKDTSNKPLMVNLDYGGIDESLLNEYHKHVRSVVISQKSVIQDKINVALIGAGNFATKTHLPNLQILSDQFILHAICDQNGYNGKYTGEKHSVNYVTSEYEEILNDKNIDLVMICTRHDSHARLVLKGLEAGKNVFVEKPLATSKEECDSIRKFYEEGSEKKPLLMVGFNRRFSPYASEAKKVTDKRINPLFMHYRMNAGFVPLDHWVHENGGRIVGEACHIIDLMTYFTGSRIQSVNYNNLSPNTEAISDKDNRSIILKYEDGSIATIEYFAVGNKAIPKETMEIHFDQKILNLYYAPMYKIYGF